MVHAWIVQLLTAAKRGGGLFFFFCCAVISSGCTAHVVEPRPWHGLGLRNPDVIAEIDTPISEHFFTLQLSYLADYCKPRLDFSPASVSELSEICLWYEDIFFGCQAMSSVCLCVHRACVCTRAYLCIKIFKTDLWIKWAASAARNGTGPVHEPGFEACSQGWEVFRVELWDQCEKVKFDKRE
jgi:hypothetical protein